MKANTQFNLKKNIFLRHIEGVKTTSKDKNENHYEITAMSTNS